MNAIIIAYEKNLPLNFALECNYGTYVKLEVDNLHEHRNSKRPPTKFDGLLFGAAGGT